VTGEERQALRWLIDQKRREVAAEPGTDARNRDKTRNRVRECVDCGTKVDRFAQRCIPCHSRHRTVARRFDENGNITEVRCSKCQEWKAAGEFPPATIQPNRKFGSRRCRECQAVIRRAQRAGAKARAAVTTPTIGAENDREIAA
jgi:hypothetical protein